MPENVSTVSHLVQAAGEPKWDSQVTPWFLKKEPGRSIFCDDVLDCHWQMKIALSKNERYSPVDDWQIETEK